MYQNMYLFLIHIAICIKYFDTYFDTRMDRAYKNSAQNDTPSDTRNKILIHHSVHQIYLEIQFLGDYRFLPSTYAFTETHQINHICFAFSVLIAISMIFLNKCRLRNAFLILVGINVKMLLLSVKRLITQFCCHYRISFWGG